MSGQPFASTVDDSDDDSTILETNVTLAFADGKLSEHDESSVVNKIGGLPSFSPVLISPPPIESATCPSCSRFMALLTQIDAPLASDELSPPQDVPNREAWLRVLYVFGCVQKECQRKPKSVRVFRALRQVDMPAPAEPEQTATESFDFGSAIFGGSTSEAVLPTEDTEKDVRNEDPVPFDKSNNRWSEPLVVLPAQYIATENEPADDPRDQETNSALVDATVDDATEPTPGGSRRKGSNANTAKAGASGASSKNTQEGFEKQKLTGLDDAFVKFQDRVFVRCGGTVSDQVLRYERGGVPLPFSAVGQAFDLVFPHPYKASSSSSQDQDVVVVGGKKYSEEGIPKCEKCGSPRTFELQLMPQLVTKLGETGPLKEQEDKLEVEWATVWCYMCQRDCFMSWAEEVAVVQFEEHAT